MIKMEKITPNILIKEGKWKEYCEKKGWSIWIVNEGVLDGDEPLEDEEKIYENFNFQTSYYKLKDEINRLKMENDQLKAELHNIKIVWDKFQIINNKDKEIMSKSNKVYIIHRHEACEGSNIIGVFWSKKKAEKEQTKLKKSFTAGCDCASLDECEIL